MTAQSKKDFIEFMLGAQVLRFGDFITKSGRNTPYFVNTGNYKTGGQIAALGSFYAARIKEACGDGFSALFGPAYKGIPLAVAAAAALAREHGIDKPYFFNRKEAKEHGEGGVLVGYQPQDSDNIIIIDDVITDGGAKREAIALLREYADITVKDMFISVNRCEYGKNPQKSVIMEFEEEYGIRVHSIVTVSDIREYLCGKDEYAHLLPRMDEYMKQYCIL